MISLMMFFARLGALSTGVGVMYLEGQAQPTPGVWFAVGVMLIALALVPWRKP